jgi:hypothetical protein
VLQEEVREFSLSSQSANNKGNERMEDEECYSASVNSEWSIISSHRQRKPLPTSRSLRQIPITTSNQFDTLTNLKTDNVSPDSALPVKNPNPTKSPHCERWAKTLSVDAPKIIIVGDSHCRQSAAGLKHCLGSTYVISSFTQPGAEMRTILSSMQADIMKLKRNDIVVIWGGSNDIGKNNSHEALAHLCNFIENNQHVNIIVLTAPLRHDLIASSCVNDEVSNFNRRLIKRTIPYKNVKY